MASLLLETVDHDPANEEMPFMGPDPRMHALRLARDPGDARLFVRFRMLSRAAILAAGLHAIPQSDDSVSQVLMADTQDHLDYHHTMEAYRDVKPVLRQSPV